MPLPPILAGRRCWRRASQCNDLARRAWYNPDDGYEYEPDPNPAKQTWHRIDPHQGLYQDIDPDTGEPVAGHEGRWRPLR